VSGTTAAAGITWGTDTNLYRSAASTLRTDVTMSALHFLCNSATPTVTFAPGTGAGTGAVASITGNDSGCQVKLTPGTAPASGAGGSQIFRVTFSTAYPNAVNAVIASDYAAVQGFVLMMAGVAYYVLTRAIIAFGGKDSLLAAAVGRDLKGVISVIVYFVAIFLAFLNPWMANALYLCVAVMWLIPDSRIERRLR